MKDTDALLSDGIRILRESDSDIENLVASRNEEIISLLVRYIKEIELFNSAYGLVGAGSTEELVIKHILDSLAPLGILLRLFKELRTQNDNTLRGKLRCMMQIADAGSGAGLPGIPLAIALPDCHFTLIERMGRRAGFLYGAKAVLELSNVTIEEKTLENTETGRFDLITFRAFKPMETKLLKVLQNACTQGGIIAAYKGKPEKTEQEMSQFKNDNVKWEAIRYNVPFLNEERHLLVIR